MSTEQTALEFIVGLTAKGVETSTNKLVTAFGTIAAAAERANEAVTGVRAGTTGGGETSEHVKKHKKAATEHAAASAMVATALTKMGKAALVSGWGLVTAGLVVTGKAYIEHTREMIQFRKVMGMSNADMSRFQGQIIGASAEFGAALHKANVVAFALSQGLVRTTADAAKLGGALAQVEGRTGVAANTSARLVKNLVDYGKVTDEAGRRWTGDDAEHFEHVLINLSAGVRGNANELVGLIAQNRNLSGLWGEVPGRSKQLVEFLGILGASYQEVGGDVSDLGGFVDQLATSDSETAKLFRSLGREGGLKSVVTWIGQHAAKMRADTGQLMRFAGQFGIKDETTAKMLLSSLEKVAGNSAALDKYTRMSTQSLREAEYGRLSDYEKIGENLRKAKNEAVGLVNGLMQATGVSGWLVTATSNLATAMAVAAGIAKGEGAKVETPGLDSTVGKSVSDTVVGEAGIWYENLARTFWGGRTAGEYASDLWKTVTFRSGQIPQRPTTASMMADALRRRSGVNEEQQQQALAARRARIEREKQLEVGTAPDLPLSMLSPREAISKQAQMVAALATANSTSTIAANTLETVRELRSLNSKLSPGPNPSGLDSASDALIGK